MPLEREVIRMAEHETKATRAMSQMLSQIEPGSPRFEALETARRFKTSWVELGSKLYSVRQGELFIEWGHPTFESYCKDELRIKPRTASKLTASYAFLKTEEPAMLKRDGLERPIPDLAAVEVLRKARDNDSVGDEDYRRIKELALEEASPASLRKELKESLPPPEPKPPNHAIKKLVEQANRLADSMAGVQGIPRLLLERALSLVDDLRKLIEN
jgi:hypothetical protein